MASGIIYALFGFFIVLGVLFGLKRGLVKSVIRFITVLVTCVLVIFLCQPITGAILSADLSSAGLMIGEIPVTTIQDTIVNYISQISVVAQLVQTSPTMLALIKAVPAILVNLILFILLFFIAKGILYFVDVIINKFVVNKEKPKRRLWGALVGGFQGLVVFLFVLIPVAGTMNLVTDTMEILDTKAEAPVQSTTLTSLGLSESALDSEGEEEGSTDDIKSVASKAVDEYNDIFIVKMFNTIGYRALTNAVYDKITVIEVPNQEKTNLRKETEVIAKVFNNYDNLKDVDFANFTAENETEANALIDNAFSSPIIGGIATELTTGLANAWTGTNQTAFAGVEKPVMDEKLINVLDTLLINLRTNTKDDLKNDLKVLVSTVKVASDYDITENLNVEGNTDAIVEVIGKDGCVENIVGTLSTGKTTKAIIPAVVEYGLSYGYEAVGLENVSADITKSADEVDWETEKVILGDMFEGVSATYISTKKEGEILNKLDFIALAKTMNAIRNSELLEGAGQTITLNFLNSNILVGVDASTLRGYVENDTKYAEMDFAVMFTTLKSSAQIATNIQDKIKNPETATDLSSADVGNLITGLTTPGATKDVLVDLASPENLTSSGVDDATAEAVGELVNSIAGYDTTESGAVQPPTTDEEVESATGAVESLLIASKNAKDDTKSYVFSTDETKAKESMNEFVSNMINSDFIYASTISKGEELGFTTDGETNLSANEQIWLNDILNEQLKTNTKCTEEKCEQIALMFGITFVVE